MSGATRRLELPIDGLSIVLPARNEAANIAQAVESSLAVARRLTARYEVIVVDDGSRDGTGEVVQALARQHYPGVRLVTHSVNQGYGAALRTGFEHARYGLVFFTDSDNQFDVGDIEALLPLMADHDLVAGFRINRDDPPVRAVYSRFYNLLVRTLFGVHVRDVNCAFKLMNRRLIDNITIESRNFFVNAELLAKARRRSFRIAEVGVRHYPRTAGRTTVRLSDIPKTLGTAFSMWFRLNGRAVPDADRSRAVAALGPAVAEFIPAPR